MRCYQQLLPQPTRSNAVIRLPDITIPDETQSLLDALPELRRQKDFFRHETRRQIQRFGSCGRSSMRSVAVPGGAVTANCRSRTRSNMSARRTGFPKSYFPGVITHTAAGRATDPKTANLQFSHQARGLQLILRGIQTVRLNHLPQAVRC